LPRLGRAYLILFFRENIPHRRQFQTERPGGKAVQAKLLDQTDFLGNAFLILVPEDVRFLLVSISHKRRRHRQSVRRILISKDKAIKILGF